MIFPWGNYSYLRLPIGIACSPDIFQVKMSKQIVAMELIYAFIDDLLFIVSVNMSSHLPKMDRNQQSDTVSVPEVIMVFNVKKCFLYKLYGPAMNKKITLSKAVLYHMWKIEQPLKTLKEVCMVH